MTNDLPMKMLNTPLAHELSESLLLLHDVKHSFGAMAIWFQKYTPDHSMSKEEQIISDCLLRDAIVQFVGCFDNSATVRLDPTVVFASTEGGVEFFGWLKDIRDGYAAHKFGAMRQSVAGVFVSPAGEAIGTGQIIANQFPIPVESRDDLLGCFRIAGRYLENRIKELEDLVLAEAKAMPPGDLLALKEARAYAITPSETKFSRKALHKARQGLPIKTRRSSRTRSP